MDQMIALLVEAVLPGARYRTVPAVHAYTEGGRQIDVWHDGEWMEIAECGQIHPGVLTGAGLDPSQWSGLALGMGLERALMLRKGIPDIRYLRAGEQRSAAQMQDLDPWRPVSMLPAITRDMSVVISADTDDETIGDTVRTALRDRVDDIESIEVSTARATTNCPNAHSSDWGLCPDRSTDSSGSPCDRWNAPSRTPKPTQSATRCTSLCTPGRSSKWPDPCAAPITRSGDRSSACCPPGSPGGCVVT